MVKHILPAVVVVSLCCLSVAPASAAEVQLHGHTFALPDGFTLELAAGAPLVERPISAAFDEQGRLYVTEASGTNDPTVKQLKDRPHRVVQLVDTDGDGRFDRRTVFADHMMLPEGAMWLDGSLYVAAPPSIWKLTDTDGDGVADKRVEWFNGGTLNGCANDLHGPYLGPDGWIYWCKGAFNEQIYERPGKPPLISRASHIFRARPDGTGIEAVMTGGMDNPVEAAFTRSGELFFTSTFVQQPAGGRRDGIIHAVYGGLYGKVHSVIDDQPHTRPDVLPVMTHLGPAAPSGLMCLESASWGEDYEQNLFATLFNLHKVTRHKLIPEGATFRTEDSDFLVAADLDFHPTDVLEDADGSLLVVDTGGWYKLCCPTSQFIKLDVVGGIYRVRKAAPDYTLADPRGLQIPWGEVSDNYVAKFLADIRPAVAARARDQLVKLWSARTFPYGDQASPTTHRVQNLWVLSRTATMAPGWVTDSAALEIRWKLNDTKEEARAVAIRAAGLARDGGATAILIQEVKTPLSQRTRRLAAEALGRIGDKAAVPAIIQALQGNNDEIVDHALTYALIEINAPEQTAYGLSDRTAAVRQAALMALEQMPAGELQPGTVAKFLSDNDSSVRDAAGWVCRRHAEWGDALAEYFRGQIEAEVPVLDRTAEFQDTLGSLATAAKVQDVMVQTLRDPLVTIDVRRAVLQAFAKLNSKTVPQPWVDVLTSILRHKMLSEGSPQHPGSLIDTVVQVAKSLPIQPAQAGELTVALQDLAADAQRPGEIRLTALAAVPGGLRQPSAAVFAFLADQVRPEQPATTRATAADILAKARLNREQLLAVAGMLTTAGPIERERLLAAIGQSADKEVGLKMIEALSQSGNFAGLRAEALKPILKKFGPDVAGPADELIKQLEAATAAELAKVNQLLAELKEGDVRRGQAVFHSRKAVCISCHSIGYVGGKVGPDLTKIGQIRSERDLVEAIVLPSASFVRSYEPIQVVTASGKVYNGLVRKETGEELTLITGPDQEVRLPREEVEDMHPGKVSVMPAGLDQQLTRQELADLVAFLRACK